MTVRLGGMDKGRLEAFTDGVLAIAITIMVLEFQIPDGTELADLASVAPMFVGYVISYAYLGVYWVNHHRLLSSTDSVSNGCLWVNLVFLFEATLVPFCTWWATATGFAPAPTFLYSLVLLLLAATYLVLAAAVRRNEGERLDLLGSKRSLLSIAGLVVAVLVSFAMPKLAYVLIVATVVPWFLPDTPREGQAR